MKIFFTIILGFFISQYGFSQIGKKTEIRDTIFYKGDMPEKITYMSNASGEYYEIQEFEYFPNDTLKKYSFVTPNYYYEANYNPRGECIEIKYLMGEIVMLQRVFEYFYTKNDQIDRVEAFNELNELQFHNQYIYDREKELEKIETYNSAGEILSIQCFYQNEEQEFVEDFTFLNNGRIESANALIVVDYGEKTIPVRAEFDYNSKNKIIAIRFEYELKHGKVQGKSFQDNVNTFRISPMFINGSVKSFYVTGHSYHGPKRIKKDDLINHPLAKFYVRCEILVQNIKKEYSIKN